MFYLLWQKRMHELAAGVYSLVKGTCQHALPVGDFMDCVSKPDKNVEANLGASPFSCRCSHAMGSINSLFLCLPSHGRGSCPIGFRI